MGVGRRMKKQGPPPPLDESRITALRKQKGLQAAQGPRGKKRRASGEVITPAIKKGANGTRKESRNGASMSGALDVDDKSLRKSVNNSKSRTFSKPQSLDELSDDDDDDDAVDLMNGFENGASDKELDMDDMALDDPAAAAGETDEFLDLETGSTHHGNVFSEEDESDAEQKLTAANIEGLSRKLDAEQRATAAGAQLELEEAALQTNITGDEQRPKIIDDDANLSDSDTDPTKVKSTLHLAPDLQLLRSRITETIRVLSTSPPPLEPGRSRQDYRSQLVKDISLYYGYSPFLAEKLLNLFPPREAFAFFESNESPRPIVIRTNTLKTHRRELAQALISRGVTLEPVGKWSKVGLQIFESPVPLGATPEYLAGHYILQAASSFLPVMALAPVEGERVLDMSAAPGGKTTHMAALMKNSGVIFANDSNKARTKALIGNLHRCGVRSSIVCNYDARQFPKVMGGFDRVLLDAPCSGTGVIAKDPSIKTNKGPRDFLALPHLQKQLLLSAIDSVDYASPTGGVVVYSTCSVTVEENEMVVQYALRKRPNVKIEDTGLGSFGVPAFTNYMSKSFDKDMGLARRYYPHKYNVDGFFVCRLRKTGPSPQEKGNGDKVTALGVNGQAERVKVNEDGDEMDVGGDGDEGTGVEGFEKEDGFGGWDESEDEVYLERARRRRLRKKGMNVKADIARKGGGGSWVDGTG